MYRLSMILLFKNKGWYFIVTTTLTIFHVNLFTKRRKCSMLLSSWIVYIHNVYLICLSESSIKVQINVFVKQVRFARQVCRRINRMVYWHSAHDALLLCLLKIFHSVPYNTGVIFINKHKCVNLGAFDEKINVLLIRSFIN